MWNVPPQLKDTEVVRDLDCIETSAQLQHISSLVIKLEYEHSVDDSSVIYFLAVKPQASTNNCSRNN